MNKEKIASLVDHSVLHPVSTGRDVEIGCEVAKKCHVAAACVKPSYVGLASRLLAGTGIKTCTVIGFPHGASTTESKVFETVNAIENGATEIDMVINIGKLLSGDEEYVYQDIKAVTDEAHKRNAIVKVIIETCYLTNEQKITACRLVKKAGADFVKTSTGFGTRGAEVEDIKLIRQTVGDTLGVKASGGIKTLEQAVALVEAGATRLGMSCTEQLFI